MKKLFLLLLLAYSCIIAMQPNQPEETDDITYTYLPHQRELLVTINPKKWHFAFHLFQEEKKNVKRIIAQNEHQEIVGAISFGGVDEKQNEIQWLEVLPCARGKGIGSELLKRAIVQLYTENKPKRVFLYSTKTALPFYCKNGMSRDIRKSLLLYVSADQIELIK